MKSLIAMLCMLLTTSVMLSLSPDNKRNCFSGKFEDDARSIVETADGSYIVAGSVSSVSGGATQVHGKPDCWIAKLDNSGNVMWRKCLGGDGEDIPNVLMLTNDGGFVIAGYTDSRKKEFSANHGNGDAWIVKMDNGGNVQWQKCLGGSEKDEAYSIIQTADGGFIIAAVTESSDGDVKGSHGIMDAWIVKLDQAGKIQWQECLGGSGVEYCKSINKTKDGGYIIAGGTSSKDGDVAGVHDGGYLDYWIVKTDQAGKIQWQKCLGGSRNEIAYSVSETKDAGFIIAGTASSLDGDVTGFHDGMFPDAWIVKTDKTGKIQWQKCFGGTKTEDANTILETDDGGFICSGLAESDDGDVTDHHSFNSDAWIIKLNKSGKLVWQKSLGGSGVEDANSIIKAKDGSYVFAGYTNSKNGDVSGHSGDYNDSWIVKLDRTGKILWEKCLGSSGTTNSKTVK